MQQHTVDSSCNAAHCADVTDDSFCRFFGHVLDGVMAACDKSGQDADMHNAGTQHRQAATLQLRQTPAYAAAGSGHHPQVSHVPRVRL